MKKLVGVVLLLLALFVNNCAFATYNIKSNFDEVEGYQFKTLLKYYKPYSIGLVNNNDVPVYFTTKSEIKYFDPAGNEYVFQNDKSVYRRSRKRDVGRYCWVTLPAAAIGGGITGITFGLGIVVGIGCVLAGMVPFLSAAKYNSNLASNIYVENKIPMSLEPKQYQMLYIFMPKKHPVEISKVIITNLSLKDKLFDLTVPICGDLK